MARNLGSVPLQLLFSAANTLRQKLQADDRAEAASNYDVLPAKISGPLADLIETHGLFWANIPEGAEIERKANAYRTGVRRPEVADAARDVVAELDGKPEVLEADDQGAMVDDAVSVDDPGPAGELAEASLIGRVSNMMGAIGRKLWYLTKAGSVASSAVVVSNDVIAFLLGNDTIIMTYLRLAQGRAADWFPYVMKALKAALGL